MHWNPRMSLSNQTCGFSLFIGCPLGTSRNASGITPEAFAIYNPSLIPANPSFIIKEARNALIVVVVDSLRGLGRSKRSIRLVHGYCIIRNRQHCAGQCDKHLSQARMELLRRKGSGIHDQEDTVSKALRDKAHCEYLQGYLSDHCLSGSCGDPGSCMESCRYFQRTHGHP